MRKTSYFACNYSKGWPQPRELEPYFLGPPGRRWFFETGNDGAAFTVEGVDGTEHLEKNNGRIDIDLTMWGHPQLGVLLIYSKWGGAIKETYSSKGDLGRLREWVRTLHNDPMPVGLFVSYAVAWKAVKEFIEKSGDLPKSIEWIANKDLPADSFPDP